MHVIIVGAETCRDRIQGQKEEKERTMRESKIESKKESKMSLNLKEKYYMLWAYSQKGRR